MQQQRNELPAHLVVADQLEVVAALKQEGEGGHQIPHLFARVVVGKDHVQQTVEGFGEAGFHRVVVPFHVLVVQRLEELVVFFVRETVVLPDRFLDHADELLDADRPVRTAAIERPRAQNIVIVARAEGRHRAPLLLRPVVPLRRPMKVSARGDVAGIALRLRGRFRWNPAQSVADSIFESDAPSAAGGGMLATSQFDACVPPDGSVSLSPRSRGASNLLSSDTPITCPRTRQILPD
mmetsp:Transcript_17136/g.34121  ORF Transcript_17136/g.34121 Transcript_17136/m.34121 type:complete len:237 (+) Transcript_17136:607-1317(+)